MVKLSVKVCVALALGLGTTAVRGQGQPTLDELLDLAPADPPAESSDDSGDTPEAGSQTSGGGGAASRAGVIEGVQERLSGEELGDAFEQAVSDMGKAAGRLDGDHDPGLDTQRLQESILARLDQLIEAAQQQQQQSGGGSSSGGSPQPGNSDSSAQNAGQQPGGEGQQPGRSPGQAQAESRGGENPGAFSPGSVGAAEPGRGALDELRTEWGALPPRLRDELSNGLDEPYSPVYREMTEAYYRRLAEETSR